MSCLQCESDDVYVEDEYYDKRVHILTMKCHDCCAVHEEHYKLETKQLVTKGNK